ncbi:SusC/RagA family TonB-linked outer membrane protein [Chitinophaga filiformis]|uniref:TonB-linked outer membrane protein, SusC/RagA family n=1 Tax=Chitinophaga filiformis TaxID=104663 RepID=A0A1G7HN87_CHIFI|nr:SusC/RagA family TonB-linked outer membrane protein [Chitinophaga filiformis]SDF01469.1 TonB-linked outer membrane protein, SusC/RagA family [Chitinophaga filiformis]
MNKISHTCSQLFGGIVVGLMCFCAVGTASAQAPEQDSIVTFSKDSMMLGEAIDSIEQRTDYVFERNNINLKQIVPVRYKNIPVRQLLAIWFKDKQVKYTIQGWYVGLNAKMLVPTKSDVIRILYGTVTDKNGRPIDKASIRLNNAKSGTTTDVNGDFSLFNVKIGTAISISCVGSITHDTTVPANNILNITLEEQTNIVKPVEVTENKPKRRRRVDSTYHFPGMKDITMGAQSNMVDDLSGKIPGVLLQRSSGRSAGARSMEIRGPTSLNRNSQALYIIDGVIITPDFKGGEGTMSQYSSTLSYLSTADIDKIIVLKSAIATALYGARGANGVVLIFTKRASHTDKTHVMADISYSFGKIARREPLLNTEGYIQLRWDALNNDGLQPTSKKAPDILNWDQHQYTDWQKELIGNTAQYKDAILTVSGEKAAVQYRVSGNYRVNSTPFMEEGSQYGDRKYGLHGSANMKLLKNRLLVTVTGLANMNETSLPGADRTTGISLPPNAPPLFKNGKINYESGSSVVSQPDFKGSISNILTTTNINYHVNSQLSFMLMAGYHRMGAHTTSIMTIAKRGREGQGNLTASSTENRYLSRTFVVEPSAQLDLRYDSHKVVLNLGAAYNSIYAGNTTIDASGYLRDRDILHYETIKNVKLTPSFNRYKYAGAHAHLNYGWKERYTLELILRLDGSSRFGKDEQVNLFGGGAVGWEFGREAFIQHAMPGLSYGKVQLGCSATGNDQIEDYQYAGSYQPAGSYQSVEGLTAAKQQNSALTGGMTYKKDLTVNLGFLDNKWEMEAAYYHNRSRHQLVEYPLPDMAGGGTIQRNMPVAIQNNGVELTLNAKLVQRKHWGMGIRLNASVGTNTLLSFPGMTAAPSGQTQLKRPLRELFYYGFYGVDPRNGEYLYMNKEGHTVNATALTENDRTVAINTSPRLYGGFGVNMAFYGFELACSGQYMVRTAENAIIDKVHIPGTMWNQNVYVDSRWRMIGDNTLVQKATQASSAEADYKKYVNSTAMFTNVWYLRMNNLTVAWQFRQYRIYCNVSNLLTLTNYKSLDPETLSRTVLPFMRIFKIGFQYYFK